MRYPRSITFTPNMMDHNSAPQFPATHTTMALTQITADLTLSRLRTLYPRITLRNGSLCNWHLFSIHLAVGLRWPPPGQSERGRGRSTMLIQILVFMYIATCVLFYVAHVIDYYFTVLWSFRHVLCVQGQVDHAEDFEDAPPAPLQKARWVAQVPYWYCRSKNVPVTRSNTLLNPQTCSPVGMHQN